MSMLTSAQITALWHYARKHRITSDLESYLWPACQEYYDYLDNLELYSELTERQQRYRLELDDMLYLYPVPDNWTEEAEREADLLKQLMESF